MTLNSSYWDLNSFGYEIYGDGKLAGLNSSTNQNNGFISNTLNITNYSRLSIKIYWVINGTLTYGINNGSWFTFDYKNGTAWSIMNFFKDFTRYSDVESGSGLFGLNQQSLNLIIFAMIFLVTGLVSYKFSISNPAIIWGIIFAMIFLFDVGLGLINVGIGVKHFPTILALIVLVALIIKEGKI